MMRNLSQSFCTGMLVFWVCFQTGSGQSCIDTQATSTSMLSNAIGGFSVPGFRNQWCQANFSTLSSALTLLSNGTCGNNTAFLSRLNDLQLICGACGNALDAVVDVTSITAGDKFRVAEVTPQTCQPKIDAFKLGLTLLNSSTCLNSTYIHGLVRSLDEDMVKMISPVCNPCMFTFLTNSDLLDAGCNGSADVISAATWKIAAAQPLCVAALCPLGPVCSASNLQAISGSPFAELLSNVSQHFIPNFGCSSAVLLTGKLTLTVGNVTAITTGDVGKMAIAQGIAVFLGLPVQANMISVSFVTTRRLDAERRLQNYLQVSYTIGLSSKDASSVQSKLNQASAQAQLTTSISAAVTTAGISAGSVSVTATTPLSSSGTGSGSISSSFGRTFLGGILQLVLMLCTRVCLQS